MAPEKKNSSSQARIIVILIIGIALVTFVVQNRTNVQTKFLFFEANLPHAVGLLITAVASFIAGALIRPFSRRHKDG